MTWSRTSRGSDGGGVYWDGSGALNITNSLFNQNQATRERRWRRSTTTSSNNVNISNTSFDGNSAADGGGVIDGDDSNALNLTQDKFSGNTAADDGGALRSPRTTATPVTTIIQQRVRRQQARSGDGGAIDWYDGAAVAAGRLVRAQHAPRTAARCTPMRSARESADDGGHDDEPEHGDAATAAAIYDG